MAGQKVLDAATLGGLVLGVGSLLTSMILEFNELNPDLGSPFLKISALTMIFGGTLGCSMASFPLEEILKIPTLFRITLFGDKTEPNELINTVVKLAELARKEGILTLESKRAELEKDYPFLSMGFQYVIDGRTPEVVKEILTDEVYAMEERHKVGANLFSTIGTFSPAMGIVGTVVGLIGALAKAGEGGSDPTAVVEAIATAFIATFYGISSANLVFLPMGKKLKARSQEEVFMKLVQIEAILAIQNGDNPRALGQSLRVYFRKDKVSG